MDACKYSFRDLEVAAGFINSFDFSVSRDEVNNHVKELCKYAGWYWEDIEKDGVVYTSFSPKKKKDEELV